MPNENENTTETNENEAELEYSFNFNVPNVQPLEVTPSTEAQEIYAPDGVSGYSPVNVGAVDATIDANITADNIREGIEILGVEGDLIELKGQEKTVNPTISAQNITPDSNFNGLTKVTVNAVTSSIDSDIKSENILEGINILGVEGSVVELKGEEKIVNLSNKDGQTFTPTGENNGITSIHVNPKNKNVTIQPQTVSQTIGIDDGYSGNGNITVNAVTKTIDTNIQSYNIKQGVEVLGVQGSVVELEGEDKTVTLNNKDGQTFTPSNGKNGLTSLTVIPHNENRTINPSTEFKTVEINEGYSGNGTLAVMPVTNQIDRNIKPQNIKQGVKILGVTGSLPTIVNNTELTVNPSTEEQVITPAGNYTGFDEVTVNPVTNAIDENILAENIKDGVTILGVEGNVIESNTTPLEVNPSKVIQTFTPTGDFTGYDTITVNPVTSAIDSDITANNIRQNVEILGVTGNVVELQGETRNVTLTDKDGQTFTPSTNKNGITSITVTPTNKADTITATTSEQTLTIPSGYSGYGNLKVNAVTSDIDSDIISTNIKSGANILGVNGSVVELNADTISITPSTSAQTITPTSPYNAFDEISVSAVTSSIDSNITAGNIKDGVTILGVTGNFDPSPTIDSLNITPTTSAQTITATGGVDGYSPVNVSAVTSSIDANITTSNIKDGVTILGVTGEVVELNADSLSVTPTTSAQTITPTSPINAFDEVNVSAVTSSIDNNIKASNIKSGVTILGVSGTVTELNGSSRSVSLTSSSGQTFNPESGKNAITSITVTPNNEARTVTPTTSSQSLTVNSGYSGNGTITVDAVTSSIDQNIQPENIKKDVVILGTTGIYEGSGGIGITREVSSNGTFQIPTTSFTFSLPSNATNLGNFALYYAFYYCTSLTSVDLSSLTMVSGSNALQYAFKNCTSLTSVDLSSLTTISGSNALQNAFNYCTFLTSVDLSSLTTISGGQGLTSAFKKCTSLTSVDLSSLTTISGSSALNDAFGDCTGLTSVDLSSLTTISGNNALYSAFGDCTGLTSIDLSSLTTISGGQGLFFAFYGCTSLASLSFPALKSTTFGFYTNQFNNMLSEVTGCTVHFPSNLQSVIGSWSDVTNGFGGTNTTVLFDLPATT